MKEEFQGIRNIETHCDTEGRVAKLRIIFGPHYFLEIDSVHGKSLLFRLGATHHGFEADATGIGVGLEAIIEAVREQNPDLRID